VSVRGVRGEGCSVHVSTARARTATALHSCHHSQTDRSAHSSDVWWRYNISLPVSCRPASLLALRQRRSCPHSTTRAFIIFAPAAPSYGESVAHGEKRPRSHTQTLFTTRKCCQPRAHAVPSSSRRRARVVRLVRRGRSGDCELYTARVPGGSMTANFARISTT
jgi:hypothetical protein